MQQSAVKLIQCTRYKRYIQLFIKGSRTSPADGCVELQKDTAAAKKKEESSSSEEESSEDEEEDKKEKPKVAEKKVISVITLTYLLTHFLTYLLTVVSAFGLSNNDGDGGCSFLAARRANGSSPWAWSKGRRPSGAVLHSSCEPGVYGTLVVTSWTCYGAL